MAKCYVAVAAGAVMMKIEANNGQPYILTALLGNAYTGALLDMVEVIFVKCHSL